MNKRYNLLSAIMVALFAIPVAYAWDGAGWDTGSTSSPVITGSTTLQGGAAVGETLGTEMIAATVCNGSVAGTGWTLTGGWSCSTGALVHTSGSVTTVTYTTNAPTAGSTYKLVWTADTPGAAGTITPKLGLVSGSARSTTASTTYTDYITAGTADVLTFTPTTTYAGTLSDISLKRVTSEITPTSGPTVLQKTMSNLTAYEVGTQIVGKTSGTIAGTKTALRVDMDVPADSTSSGTENIFEGYADGVQKIAIQSTGTIACGSTGYLYTNNIMNSGANVSTTALSLANAVGTGTTGNIIAVHVKPTYNETSGTASNTALLVQPTYTDSGTGTQQGVEVRMHMESSSTNSNTGVSGLAYGIHMNGSIAPMDNSDTYKGIYVAPINADHSGTGNSVSGIEIEGLTQDLQASEYALKIGAGWDFVIYSDATRGLFWISDQADSTNLYYGMDIDNATTSGVIKFGQNTSSAELNASSGVQDFLKVAPETNQTSTAGYNAIHVLVGEPTPYTGSGGSGAQNLLLLETGHEDFSSPVEKFKVARNGQVSKSISAAITADAGSAQGGSPLTSALNVITVVATAGDSVTLPAATAGLTLRITNRDASDSADVFPASGDSINGGSADAAKALAAAASMDCYAVDTASWECVTLAR